MAIPYQRPTDPLAQRNHRSETLRHELAMRGLVDASGERGIALRISVRELHVCWPEAGRVIGQRAIAMRE